MKKLLNAALAAMLCAAGAAAAETMTLAEAQRRALEIAPQLAGQRAAIRASREMAVAAGQRPDPVLKLAAENVPIDGPDRLTLGNDFMTMRRIGVMQEFTRSDKLALRSERYDREAARSDSELRAAVAVVERDTALAWLEAWFAESMATVIAEQREAARREVEAVEANYRAGRGGQAEVFAARGALVALEDRASEIRKRISTSRTALARWIGPAALEPLAGRPSLESIPDEFAVEHLGLEHHPEIQAARGTQEIAATEVRLARANRETDWTWELWYSRRGSPYSDMVSLGVSVPLPWDRPNRQDREVSAKLASLEQAGAQREDLLRMHVAEVRSLVTEWESGRERLRRYETELLPLSRQRTEASVGAYRGGKGTLPDVLASRRSELDVRLQQLQLELETARAWAKLNFLFPVDLQTKEAK